MTREPQTPTTGPVPPARPATMTVHDEGGKLRAAMARGAQADAIRMREGRPLVFGSIRDVLLSELDRMTQDREPRAKDA